MKLSPIAVIGIAFLSLSSCMWGTQKNQAATGDFAKDTLAYTYQTVKQRADDCGNKPDSGCTVAAIKYPLIPKNKALTDTIEEKLINLFSADEKDTSAWQASMNFIRSYTNFKKDPLYNPKIFFTLNSYAKVLRQDSSLTTLEVGGYEFSGGAHGITLVHFINWDRGANKNLQLSDILVDGYDSKLTKTAELIFRKNEELSITAPLKDNYFFKDGKFALNGNFLITPTGLRFLYNIYEIKPYAAGRTELDIPWFQIKYLLKPNTVISQYIK